MEKYRYTFRNVARTIDTVEAETLDVAMKKAGVEQYQVKYIFPYMAVIAPAHGTKFALGVTWEAVEE